VRRLRREAAVLEDAELGEDRRALELRPTPARARFGCGQTVMSASASVIAPADAGSSPRAC